MFLCMRTTVDMPDKLFRKLKRTAAEKDTTMRELIVDAVSRSLQKPEARFRLRDASVGPKDGSGLDPQATNQAIDQLREPIFRP